MEIGETLRAKVRADWRAWLESHHASAPEIWVVLGRSPEPLGLTYLDAVEEAICFGWIDGISKTLGDHEQAQRFTPRRARSNWTELNKERARRLEALRLMTPAGRAVPPNLDEAFRVLPEVERALRADLAVWANFTGFPDLYRRVTAEDPRVHMVPPGREHPSGSDSEARRKRASRHQARRAVPRCASRRQPAPRTRLALAIRRAGSIRCQRS